MMIKRITMCLLLIVMMTVYASAQTAGIPQQELPGGLVEIGIKEENFIYQSQEPWNGRWKIYYRFTVVGPPMKVKLDCSIYGSAVSEFSFLDKKLNMIGDKVTNLSIERTFMPGTYYALVNIYGYNLIVNTTMRGYQCIPSSFEEPTIAGTFDNAFEYRYPFDTSLFKDEPDEVFREATQYFKVGLNKSMQLDFMTSCPIGDIYSSTMCIKNEYNEEITSASGVVNAWNSIVLIPGTYYVTVKGAHEGEMELNLKGKLLEEPEGENNYPIQYRYDASGNRTKNIKKQ